MKNMTLLQTPKTCFPFLKQRVGIFVEVELCCFYLFYIDVLCSVRLLMNIKELFPWNSVSIEGMVSSTEEGALFQFSAKMRNTPTFGFKWTSITSNFIWILCHGRLFHSGLSVVSAERALLVQFFLTFMSGILIND